MVSFSLFYFFHKVCRKLQPHLSIEVNRLVSVHLKNHFFLPTSRKVLSTFQKICPVGVQFAQTVVHFAHFQVQARKSGVLGWGWGCFVSVHVPERSLWRLSKEQGLMVIFWAKWDPSGQFVRKVGNSALELGKKIQSCTPSHLSQYDAAVCLSSLKRPLPHCFLNQLAPDQMWWPWAP